FLMTVKPYAENLSPCRLTVYPHPYANSFGRIKSLAYLDRLRIADYALKQGFDDAVVQDHEGLILETSIANLFWKAGQEVYFPDSTLPLYQGITLQILLEIMGKMGLKTLPVKARIADISEGSQIFLCNSLKGIVPITSIESREFKRDLAFESNLRDSLQVQSRLFQN
ncbi:MAG TPA: aminotransferase class IV, partial [Parachlamydiaceae bacterium]|nr:aminotransferase class IV [Parachlamydiaceae bacterium]